MASVSTLRPYKNVYPNQRTMSASLRLKKAVGSLAKRLDNSVLSLGQKNKLKNAISFLINRCLRMLLCALTNSNGATTTEYALLLALVVVVLIGTLSTLGAVLNAKLQNIIEQVQNAQ